MLNVGYSQKHFDLDSVQKALHKSYKGSLKILKNKSDSAYLVVGYNKSNHKLLGVQILVQRPFRDSPYPGVSQYAFHFLPENFILLKVITEHSDGKHSGDAKFLFKDYKLVSKEENKYIEQNFSNLISKCEFYKQLGNQIITEKFSK
jgi:hypothetical protein